MTMEIPNLEEYIDDIIEVKYARLRDECTMECEFCDCTRDIKLPGKSLVDELNIPQEESMNDGGNFVDKGRLKLNRKKQSKGLGSLINLLSNGNINVKPIFARVEFQVFLRYSTTGVISIELRIYRRAQRLTNC